MNRNRRVSKGKKINPHFWVFCEGDTEKEYIYYLRSEYRLPVQIVPKVAGCDVSERYIENYKRGLPVHEKDMDFLIYDGDVPEVMARLSSIRVATLLVSNPCIELWYLLHFKNQSSSITEDDCIRQISNRNRSTYVKGIIDESLRLRLSDRRGEACVRAKALPPLNNPSTNMYLFIEALEKAKSKKRLKKI
jgi:hypothetical protein